MSKTKIHIESAQWTPGREPVLVFYIGKDVKTGPLAKTTMHHTTQLQLRQLTTNANWGDEEVIKSVQNELAASGFDAEVELPEPEPELAPEPKEAT